MAGESDIIPEDGMFPEEGCEVLPWDRRSKPDKSSQTAHTAILGLQWGDEGKGKLVDVLAAEHDTIGRWNGGGNAGHTVKVDDVVYILHLLPSGVVAGKTAFVGPGVHINFDGVQKEINELKKRGTEFPAAALRISERAHIVTPWHLCLELANEAIKHRKGREIGTTMQGIGPTSGTKVGREGIRTVDLFDATDSALKILLKDMETYFDSRIDGMDIDAPGIAGYMERDPDTFKMTQFFRETYFHDSSYVRFDAAFERFREHRDRFRQHREDITDFLGEEHMAGRNILFEGAQGAMLDIDHGTYPYVTTTTTTAGGIGSGTGITLPLENRIGVLKAYTTRVGSGNLPTELKDETGNRLRKRGAEYGATTKRPRRVGWLDLVVAKYAVMLNGTDQIAITKLDVLDEEEKIKVCVGYEVDGEQTDRFPASNARLGRVTPIYITLPGWKQDTSKIRTFSELPTEAQDYILFIEDFLRDKVPYLKPTVRYISVGAGRGEIIRRAA